MRVHSGRGPPAGRIPRGRFAGDLRGCVKVAGTTSWDLGDRRPWPWWAGGRTPPSGLAARPVPGLSPEADALDAGRLVPPQATYVYSSVTLAPGTSLTFHVTSTVSKLKLTMWSCRASPGRSGQREQAVRPRSRRGDPPSGGGDPARLRGRRRRVLDLREQASDAAPRRHGARPETRPPVPPAPCRPQSCPRHNGMERPRAGGAFGLQTRRRISLGLGRPRRDQSARGFQGWAQAQAHCGDKGGFPPAGEAANTRGWDGARGAALGAAV